MEKACIRCGTQTTPLWRPEVLAGPKVLCNACGVRALYSSKQRGSRDVTTANNNQTEQYRIAADPSPEHTAQQHVWQSNKRQRTDSSTKLDVRVTTAQKPFFSLVYSYDSPGQNVISWRVTDLSIDDAREFTDPMHAQEFIDECWLFIRAHVSKHKTLQGGAAQAQQDKAPAQARKQHPAAKTAQQHQPGKPARATGQETRLHEAAALADRASRPSSTSGQQSRLHQPAAVPNTASTPTLADVQAGRLRQSPDAVKQGGRPMHAGGQEGRLHQAAAFADQLVQHSSPSALRLPSILRPCISRQHPFTLTAQPHVARSDTLLPAEPPTSPTPSRPVLRKPASSPSAAPITAAAAAPPAAGSASSPAAPATVPPAATKDSVPAASASLSVHPPSSSHRPGPPMHPSPDPPAAALAAKPPAAAKNTSPAAEPAAALVTPWPRKSSKMANVALLHAPDKSCAVKRRAAVQTPGAFARKSAPKVQCKEKAPLEASKDNELAGLLEQMTARKTELANGSMPHAQASGNMLGMIDSRDSDAMQAPQSKPPGAAHEVSNSNTTKLPLVDTAPKSCGQPLSSGIALPMDDPSGLPATLGPVHPAPLPETAQAPEPVSPVASSPVRQGSSSICSELSSFARGLPSWASQKPRSKKKMKPRSAVLPSAASLALIAAAAAAEAEAAAASAAAAAIVRSGYASGRHAGHTVSAAAAKQGSWAPQQQNRYEVQHQARPPALPESSGDPQHKRSRHNDQDTVSEHAEPHAKHRKSPDCDQSPSVDDEEQGTDKSFTYGMAKQHTGRRVLKRYKPHDYVGSQYCGVNGIRHTAGSPLRWRAGTWDPVVKKTAYIGSYDVEEDAAAAVDTWHVSQGRSAVNFPDGTCAKAGNTSGQHHDIAYAESDGEDMNEGLQTSKVLKAAGKDMRAPTVAALGPSPPGQPARARGSASAVRGARALVAKAAGRSPAAAKNSLVARSELAKQQLGLSEDNRATDVSAASNKWHAQVKPCELWSSRA